MVSSKFVHQTWVPDWPKLTEIWPKFIRQRFDQDLPKSWIEIFWIVKSFDFFGISHSSKFIPFTRISIKRIWSSQPFKWVFKHLHKMINDSLNMNHFKNSCLSFYPTPHDVKWFHPQQLLELHLQQMHVQ